MTIMIKTLYIFLILFYALCSQNLKLTVDEFQKSQSLQNAQWSLHANYVDNKKIVIDHNANQSLVPASGLKIITAGTALDILGTDFTFKTHLSSTGEISGNVLQGDLVIIGGGDPTLGSELLEGALPLDSLMMNWIEATMQAGINKINGSIMANTGLYDEQITPAYWSWLNLGNYFGAGAGAMNINDNLYHLVFKPGKVGWLAKVIRMEPEIPGLEFTNYMKTGKKGSGDNGYIYCAPNQFNAVLRGSIPAGREEFKIKGSIPNPALFTAQYFKNALINSGIEITGNAQTNRSSIENNTIFHTVSSPFLKEILKLVLKKSNNLFAEGIGKMAGHKSFSMGSNRNSVKAIEKFLEECGIETESLDLNDACGLSPANLVSAKLMTDFLTKMVSHKDFDTFYNAMAVAGKKEDTGSFRNWGNAPDNAKKARLKSGLIKHVRSHSGYVKDQKDRLIAFSFIANNFQGSTRQINKFHKELIIKLAELD